jgi:hypothetical protein
MALCAWQHDKDGSAQGNFRRRDYFEEILQLCFRSNVSSLLFFLAFFKNAFVKSETRTATGNKIASDTKLPLWELLRFSEHSKKLAACKSIQNNAWHVHHVL